MEKSVLISDFVKMTKQDKRLANKKRKAEVLLSLLNQKKRKSKTDSSDDSDEENDVSHAKKSKISDELDDKTLLKIEKKKQKKLRLKEIRMQIKKLQKQESNPKERPVFHLNLQELLEQQQRSRSETRKQSEELPTLYMLDVQHLLTLALLPDSYTHYPRWCKLARPSKVTSVVVIVLDQLGAADLEEYQQCFPFMKKTFQQFAEVVSPYQYKSTAMNDIFLVPFSNTALKTKAFKENNKQDKIEKKTRGEENMETDDVTPKDFSRKHLLLNPLQLMHEGYPMPVKTVKDRYKDFQFSFKSYKAVTKKSPMFAVDCEMCMTTSGESELTRISVVNEKLETVYDTLVKPHNRVINYLTQYSGITKKMLDPVKTRLKEVQRKLKQLLPSDSIWLGQSLNNDLMALKLFHPYVIDTSVIYNLSGFKWKKTGLKILAAQFLKQDIQCGAEGHSSVEDARATMELVQLKLKKGILFGDATLAMLDDEEDMETADKSADKSTEETGNTKVEEKQNPEAKLSENSEKLKADTTDSPTTNTERQDDFEGKKDTVEVKGDTVEGKAETLEVKGETLEAKGETESVNETKAGSKAAAESSEPTVSRVHEKRRLFFQQHQGQYRNFLNMANTGKKSAVVIDKKENMADMMPIVTAKCVDTNSDKSRTQEAVSAVQSADFVWVQFHGLANLDTSTGEEDVTAAEREEEGTALEKKGEKHVVDENLDSEDGEIKDDPQKLKCLKRMDKRVQRIVRKVRSKTLVCVVLTGQTNQNSVHNGGVLIKIT